MLTPDSNQKQYYPICKHLIPNDSINDNSNKNNHKDYIECGGPVKIKINPNNFSISYECEYDKSHTSSDINFPIYENFYLKEREIPHCSKCNNHEYGNIFRCYDCNSLFCLNCLVQDKIDNLHSNFEIYNENICSKHHLRFEEFCKICKKNICQKCFEECNHEYKSTFNYSRNTLTLNETFILRKRIEEKCKLNKEIIKKIADWKTEIIIKTDQLIKNLNSEISIIEKIANNFNKDFLNYNYYKSVINLKDYIINFDQNENLLEFKNSKSYEEKTINLFKLLNNLVENNENEILFENNNKRKIITIYNKDFITIKHLKDNYFFIQYKNSISIQKLDLKNKTFINYIECPTVFEDYIYNINISSSWDQLYACTKNHIVKIINFDLEQKKLTVSDEQIGNNIITCYKCIDLSCNYYATSNISGSINIWEKNLFGYEVHANIDTSINNRICDLLSLNNGNLIYTKPNFETLIFYDSKLKANTKILKHIDSIESYNSLILVKNKYIYVHCQKGIAVVLVPTKEFVSYIKFDDLLYNEKKIIYDGNNFFYNYKIINAIKRNEKNNLMFKNYIHIYRYKIHENDLDLDQKYEIKKEIDKNYSNYVVIYVTENELIFLPNFEYL